MSASVGVVRSSAPAFSLSGLMAAVSAWQARRHEIARISRELESMSNRELRELGICRSDIRDVARGECASAYPAN